jgi:hypothetical protein
MDRFRVCKIALESFIKLLERLKLKNKFVSIIKQLPNELPSRIADFYSSSNKICLFENPIATDINEVPAQMQMKTVELQSKDPLTLLSNEIHCNFLPNPIFKFTRQQDLQIKAFCSSNICKKAFSVMTCRKNKYRSALTNEHLHAALGISPSSLKAVVHN